MESVLSLRSFGRFLYTQNPFYLISCFLIIYGLQVATIAHGDLASRSMMLAAGTLAYTLLMAATCVGVVRLGKVWEDARSIFFIVVISFVAFSIGLDELCVIDWNVATAIMLAGGAIAVTVTETLLKLCQLKFPFWYRVSFYALMCIFYAAPLILGNAVAERQESLTNWGPLLFSTSIAAALLLLGPAIRRGAASVQHNGSPWQWPLYPLSLFAIIILLAGIRAHALWMAFGFIGMSVQFEPLLLLPIAFAVLILLLEVDAGSPTPICAGVSAFLAPALLLFAVTPGGSSHLPIQNDLREIFGSPATLCMLAMAAFFAYAWFRRVPGGSQAAIVSLLALSFFGTAPPMARSYGLMPWMFALLATLIYAVICLRTWRSDQKWFALSSLVSVTIMIAFRSYGDLETGLIVAAIFSTLAMLAIGAIFGTELADFLRVAAAAGCVAGTGGIVFWHFSRSPGSIVWIALAVTIITALIYFAIVRRWGWLWIAGFQAACLAGLLALNTYRNGAFQNANLPIQSGLACFVVGVTITSLKSGAHRSFLRRKFGRRGAWPIRRGF